jgi:hypothetical protein
MTHKYVRTPVNVGEKIRKPGEPAADEVKMSSLRDGAEELFDSYEHRRSRFLDVDYKLDDEGQMQLHIFPRVPDYDVFLPNNQAFAEALETAVVKVFGRAAEVVAEFNELDGVHIEFDSPDDSTDINDLRQNALTMDTRVDAYLRKEDGSLTHVLHTKKVPSVWFCVKRVPGLMMPKAQAMEMLVENVIETTERLLPRA